MYNYIKGVGEIWVGHKAPPSDSTNILWLKLDSYDEQSNGQLLWWNPKKGHWDTATTDYMLFNNIYGVADPPESFVPVTEGEHIVYLGAGAGIYTNFLNENGKPIVIESNTALVALIKVPERDFWTYKTLELKGEKGDAATIVVGDVHTGEPGSEARIWNSGDETHAVFNFIIPRGNRGFHFTPHVDKDSNLSWSNNGNLENPETVNIKGDKGDKGDQGEVGPIGPMPNIVALSNRINVSKSTIEGDNTVGLDVEQRNIEHDTLKNRELPDAHPISAITDLQEALDSKVDDLPDGVTPLLTNGTINSRYLSKRVLEVMKYGGTFGEDGIIHSEESDINGVLIDELPEQPTLNDSWKGWYFVCKANYTLKGVLYKENDWAVNIGKEWLKVTNTYTGKEALKINDTEVSLKINPACKLLVQDDNGLLCSLDIRYDGNTGRLSFYGKDNQLISTVDLPVEQLLNNAELVTEVPSGTPGDGPWLKLVFNVTDSSGEQSTQTVYMDLHNILSVISAGNGIAVNDGEISIKLVQDEPYLETSAAGLATKGINEAIALAVKTESDRATAAEADIITAYKAADTAITDIIGEGFTASSTIGQQLAAVKTTADNAATKVELTDGLALKLDKNADITAGTATKITFDSKGLVVKGESLLASDIPNLDASKITTGVLPVARGGTGQTDLSNVTVGNASKVPFEGIQDKPTTLSGYGITDAASKTELAGYLPLTGGTLTGELNIDVPAGKPFVIKTGLYDGHTWIGVDTTGTYINNVNGAGATTAQLRLTDSGKATLHFGGSAFNEIWHSGNLSTSSFFKANGLTGAIKQDDLDIWTDRNSGFYTITNSYANKGLIKFKGAMSASGLEILFNYSLEQFQVRTTIDSERYGTWNCIMTSREIQNIKSLTQSEYNSLPTKYSNILYVIVEG